MAPQSRLDLDPSVYRYHRRTHAEVYLEVYEVRDSFWRPTAENLTDEHRSLCSQSLNLIASGGSFAEEVISTIRTAQVRFTHPILARTLSQVSSNPLPQAFGTQSRLSQVYGTHIDRAFAVDNKAAVVHGASMAIFFFIIYASYGLAFSFGTTLLLQGHGNVGTIINV